MSETTNPTELPLTVSRVALLEEGSDARFRQLIHRLLAYASTLEAIRAGLGGMIGLTGIQFTMLISIAHQQRDTGVGVKEVADHLNCSGAFVTIETGKLCALGLVEKRQNAGDKRRVLLTVTTRGRELLSGLAPAQRQVNDTLFASLDQASFEHMCKYAEDLATDARNAQALVEFLTESKTAALS